MRVLVVNNPRSGIGDGGLFDFANVLGRQGAEVTLRYIVGGATVADLLADATSFDRVVAAGGDGTVSSVAYALRGSGVPIVAFPAGTANLIAQNLGMPTDSVKVAHVALGDTFQATDLGELTYVPARADAVEGASRTTGFVMAAGAGFDAKVMQGAHGLKDTLGPAAYLVAAMQNLAPAVSRFTLDLDGEAWETEGIAVLLVNFARLQFDVPVIHQTEACDGLIDVVVARTKSVPELLPGIWAAVMDRLGTYVERPGLEVRQAKRVEIYADPPLPLESDGEVLGASTPMRARMLQGAVTFVVP